MSAHTRRKAQRKYKQHLLSERESNQLSISTALSDAELVRRLRERRKFDAALAVNDGASTSTVAVAEPVDVQCSDEAPASAEDDCGPMEVEFNRIDIMPT